MLNVFVPSFRADVLARGDAGESEGTGESVRAFRALRHCSLGGLGAGESGGGTGGLGDGGSG